MQLFPATFLLLLQQLALGGLFALAVPPFHEMERGFYKSTAAVLFIAALLALWGKADLFLRVFSSSEHRIWAAFELFFCAAFVILLALYLISLWGERTRFRARAFSSSCLIGLAGLVLTSFNLHKAPFLSVESFLFPLSLILSSLLLGSAIVGMLLGHWYLIDAGQSLTPLILSLKFFVYVLVFQIVFFLLSLPALSLLGSQETLLGIGRLWEEHLTLFSARILVAQIGPLILSYMIWQTLKIPHTMAATGLFYIALLGVFVGEILGRHLFALTALPF